MPFYFQKKKKVISNILMICVSVLEKEIKNKCCQSGTQDTGEAELGGPGRAAQDFLQFRLLPGPFSLLITL